MSSLQTTIIFIVLPIAILAVGYAMFPRKTKNFLTEYIPAWKKRYVFVHVRYQSGQQDSHKVVPNATGLTQVGKYSYNLSNQYSLMKSENRYHFYVDELDSIPRTFNDRKPEDIVFQAAEIQTALNNSVMTYLFSRKKDLLVVGLFVLGGLTLLAIIYNVYELNGLKAAVAAIAQAQNSGVEVIP